MAEQAIELDSDDENFEDALETVPSHTGGEIDLEEAIEDTTIALHYFLNNQFSLSDAKLRPYAHHSMYHSLGLGTLLFFQAVMTFDPRDIDGAMEALKNAVVICSKHRRQMSVAGSITKMVRRPNYDAYTDVEIHAELCYAECLLLRALLTFIQDENLISFVRGGLKIRSCYQSYKECLLILKHRTWSSEYVKCHFESGVRMGVGAFNLLISILPARVLKLLEFIGFSGNKTIGLKELDRGTHLKPGLRGPLCALILIFYHTILTHFAGLGDGNLEYAASILNPLLQVYPNGALFLFFAGRLQEIQGNVDEGIVWLQKSVKSQHEWRQFHHLCYWELMWCHSFKCEWSKAAHYAGLLLEDSRWSKATYSYQKAVFLCMLQDDETDADTKASLQKHMNDVPQLKQRIAGKSLPIEKFAVKKSERFNKQNGTLVLPAVELAYVWNGFAILGKNPELVHKLYDLIERTISDMEKSNENDPFYMDNYYLCILLKGMCLKYMSSPLLAETCFREVWESEKKLKEDTYLVPFALVELGLLCLHNDQLSEAQQCLEAARSQYKGYSLESRLHFKVHSGMAQMKVKSQQLPTDPPLAVGNSPQTSPNTSPVNSPVHIVPPSKLENNSTTTSVMKNGIYPSLDLNLDTRL